MKMLLQIGITGGIGAGKSLVTQIFHTLGIPVYDADSHAKKLMLTDPVLVGRIKKEFGDEAYLPDGNLNRAYLSQQAFGNSGKVDVLNALVHPRVAEDYETWTKRYPDKPYVLKEAALLFEAGSAAALNKIIVVTAREELRISRVLRRDPRRTEAEVKKIIASQMSDEEKIRRADYLITNNEEELLIPQVLRLHALLLK